MNVLNLFDSFLYTWKYPACIVKNLKYALKLPKKILQRATRGWCDSDCWNLNEYIGTILPEMIFYLKDNCSGHPYDMTQNSWENCLDEIARCIKRGIKDSFDNNPFEVGTIEWKDAQEKLENERKAALKRGFELLSEHFDDLWD